MISCKTMDAFHSIKTFRKIRKGHTWHGTDFLGNFPENCWITEKANYSTENSGNFRRKSNETEILGKGSPKILVYNARLSLFPKILVNYVPFVTWNVQTRDAFHKMKNFDMNFRKYPVSNATSFSGISGKENNLARRTKIFFFLAE